MHDATQQQAAEDSFPLDASRMAPTAALLRASISVRHAFVTLVDEPLDIDPDVADLLLRIAESGHPGLRGVDCARQLKVSPTRVTRLADRAEAAGLITRVRDVDDRRAQRLVLTDSGRRMVHDLAPRIDALLQAMVFETFTEQELSTLTGLLHRLSEAANTLAAPPVPEPPDSGG